MPVAILPDISEQHCIGCALCVEICTSLGPDVLRVKPVEGWKRGTLWYSILKEHSDGHPRVAKLKPSVDETNDYTQVRLSTKESAVQKGGRRLNHTHIHFYKFSFVI